MDISVLVAVKNEEENVEEALRSVLEQACTADFEVIVVDDDSSDSTATILDDLSTEFERLIVLDNPGSGKVAAFNYAFSRSSGALFCFFSGDDIMTPHSLHVRAKALGEVCPDRLAIALAKQRTMSENPAHNGHVIPRAKGRGTWSGTCVMFNIALAKIVFPIPVSLPNEDTWTEAIARHVGACVLHVPHIVCLYRIHGGNTMGKTLPFSIYSSKLNARYFAYSLVEQRLAEHTLPLHAQVRLHAVIQLENARFQGSFFRILSVREVSWVERLRALVYGVPILYRLRQSMYGFFAGRG